VRARPDALLLSIHTFTPELNGRQRPFDVGVLFDAHDDLAHALAADVTAAGFAVRMNEPYSGLDGLIFSARRHGRRHGTRYLELEINNRLLRRDDEARAVARRLVDAVARLVERPSDGGR
jgi:predicted N-formylglutamate amidohydrolase